jgi:hypothetical protein
MQRTVRRIPITLAGARRRILCALAGVIFTVVVLLMAGAVLAAVAQAQSPALVRVEAAVLIPPLQRLEVEAAWVELPSPTPLDMAAGFVDAPGPILLRIRSNVPWELTAQRVEDEAAVTQTPGEGQATRLLWCADGDMYRPLARNWVTIASGEPTEVERRIDLHVRVPLSWSQTRPGVYEPRIEFRLLPAGM